MNAEVQVVSAFSGGRGGGNPAGVVLDAASLDESDFRRIAADVGASETAFVVARADTADGTEVTVRYFSPAGEIPFCGHATLGAAAVLLHDGADGRFRFTTSAGIVEVIARRDQGGVHASFRSVPGRLRAVPGGVVHEVMSILGWHLDDLDLGYPPLAAFGGSWHLILATGSRARLSRLDYDPAAMRSLLDVHGWATVHLVCAESTLRFHARGVFPAGDLLEDPATGSAAAAFAHYLYTLGHADRSSALCFRQGEDMGSPCELTATDAGDGQILVGGDVRFVTDQRAHRGVAGFTSRVRPVLEAEPRLWWRAL